MKVVNRIVKTEVVDPNTLVDNLLNFRTHPEAQADAMREVLDSVGWVQTVVVNINNNHIVDGHLRAQIARERGEKIPVNWVDLTEEEEQQMLSVMDPIAAMAVTDTKMLSELLSNIQFNSPDFFDIINNVHDVDSLLDSLTEQQPDSPEEFPEVDENIKTEHECPKCGYRWSGKIDVEVSAEDEDE